MPLTPRLANRQQHSHKRILTAYVQREGLHDLGDFRSHGRVQDPRAVPYLPGRGAGDPQAEPGARVLQAAPGLLRALGPRPAMNYAGGGFLGTVSLPQRHRGRRHAALVPAVRATARRDRPALERVYRSMDWITVSNPTTWFKLCGLVDMFYSSLIYDSDGSDPGMALKTPRAGSWELGGLGTPPLAASALSTPKDGGTVFGATITHGDDDGSITRKSPENPLENVWRIHYSILEDLGVTTTLELSFLEVGIHDTVDGPSKFLTRSYVKR
ncbi:hypothetical protein DL771_010022 [Monosporascus sp. 5C6A]|nr:hypothetical protein DL771_010022 [Monosporascus sp. 5C6A]